MSTQTRTSPPTDPVDRIERFAGPVDQHVEDGEIDPCGRCGSSYLDGWMDEGAICLWTVCVRCGSERQEEVDDAE